MTTNTPPKPPSPPHHDNLTPLPPEILQQIASYLYATHNPRLAYEEPINPRKPTLLSLSSVNKTLHAQTNAWAHHHLHAHRAITKYKDYKTAQAAARQRPLLKLLRWSAAHCVFCGKNSKRRAILMNGLRCCGACDRVQWAEKITKTKAKKDFRLSEEQLLPGKGVPGFLRVRYGTYWSAGVLTTMFLRRDVERLAELVKEREAGNGVKGRKKVEGVSKRVEREVEVLETAEAGTSRAVEVRRVGGKEVVVIDDEDD